MRLPMPTISGTNLINDVVRERQRGKNAAFFNNLADEWQRRNSEYLINSGSPEHLRRWTDIDARKDTFLNLYLSPKKGSVQGNMLETLRDHKLTLCPSCGEDGRPNTLDHYLPKDLYPDFCITPENLFPMCDACQNAKGNKVGDSQSPRFFLHPYFDIFVGHRVLELRIAPPFDVPTFQLSACSSLTMQQTALVNSHIRELRVENRYAHFFREQHMRLLRLAYRSREEGQDVHANLLMFEDLASGRAKNSWEHVFYNAVLSNNPLLDYLKHGQLPMRL